MSGRASGRSVPTASDSQFENDPAPLAREARDRVFSGGAFLLVG